MIKRKATASWRGTGTGGSGSVSTSSSALSQTPLSFRARFTGQGGEGSTNPEELLGAAYASCYMLSLAFALEQAGHAPESIEVDATVSLDEIDGGFEIGGIHVSVTTKVAGIEEDELEETAEAAKALCPLGLALHAVPVTLDVTLHG